MVDVVGRLVGIVRRVDLLTWFLRSDEELRREIFKGVFSAACPWPRAALPSMFRTAWSSSRLLRAAQPHPGGGARGRGRGRRGLGCNRLGCDIDDLSRCCPRPPTSEGLSQVGGRGTRGVLERGGDGQATQLKLRAWAGGIERPGWRAGGVARAPPARPGCARGSAAGWRGRSWDGAIPQPRDRVAGSGAGGPRSGWERSGGGVVLGLSIVFARGRGRARRTGGRSVLLSATATGRTAPAGGSRLGGQ